MAEREHLREIRAVGLRVQVDVTRPDRRQDLVEIIDSRDRAVVVGSDAEQTATLAVTGTRIELAADMRYDGQGYDVTVPLDETWLMGGDFGHIRAAFHAAHRATYGHANETAEIWLKELRAHITGATPKPRIIPLRREAAARAAETRSVRLFGREVGAAVHERAGLGVGQRLAGPAIVNQMDTTTWIPPGWEGHVVPCGALVLERSSQKGAKPA